MEFLEKNLEDIIFETPTENLDDRGLYVLGKRYRQLRIGNYGIADMVTMSREYINYPHTTYSILHITVYELKKNKLDENTLCQASRYVKGIKRYIKQRNIFNNCSVEFKIVLVGKTFNLNNSFVYLADFVDNVEIYTYEYKFNGINFIDHSGWYLKDEGF